MNRRPEIQVEYNGQKTLNVYDKNLRFILIISYYQNAPVLLIFLCLLVRSWIFNRRIPVDVRSLLYTEVSPPSQRSSYPSLLPVFWTGQEGGDPTIIYSDVESVSFPIIIFHFVYGHSCFLFCSEIRGQVVLI